MNRLLHRLTPLIIALLLVFSSIIPAVAEETTTTPTNNTSSGGGGDWFSQIVNAFQQAWSFISGIPQAIYNAISGVGHAVIESLSSIGEAIVNALGGVKDFFSKIADFIGKLGDFIMKSIGGVTQALNGFIEGWNTLLGNFLGNWGDIDTYNWLMANSLGRPLLREAIGNCTAGIGSNYTVSRLGLLAPITYANLTKPEETDENICHYLERITPSGLLGHIHWFTWGVGKSTDLIKFLIKNGFMILAAVSVFMLVMGLNESIRKRSMDPMVRTLEILWKIYVFPIKLLFKIVEFIIKAIESIAQVIESALPF